MELEHDGPRVLKSLSQHNQEIVNTYREFFVHFHGDERLNGMCAEWRKLHKDSPYVYKKNRLIEILEDKVSGDLKRALVQQRLWYKELEKEYRLLKKSIKLSTSDSSQEIKT